MARARWLVALCTLVCASMGFGQETTEGRLLRFPDVSRDKVVFSYGGDLWLAAKDGGTARRITSNPGLELFPKFSPDGKWIAFTGQYDGHFNVYIIPAEGGQPKQLTFLPDVGPVPERMGPNNEVIAWYPDSQRILFLSRCHTINIWFGQLFSVSIDGGLPERLPILKGGLTSFSPDGTRIAYNRIFRNFRTWKRYEGGMAQDIWIYDFKTNNSERITGYPGTDTSPMWHGDTIYFTSDRGPERRLNLYSYDLKSKRTRQLTQFADYDLEWPSLGPDAIVFENGGWLYRFDLQSGKAEKLTIQVPGDFDLARKRWINPDRWVSAFDLSPEGKRAGKKAPGQIFTSPAEHGIVRHIAGISGVQIRDAAWSPDGQWIAYLSDQSGEYELYIKPQDGVGPEQRITTDDKVFLYAPVWSPDSRKLLFSDKDLRLYYVDLETKTPVLIDRGEYAGDLTDYVFSPDSQWVAYAKYVENNNHVLYLYHLTDRRIERVTTGNYDSWNPFFDPGGDYLYFLSNRVYNEALGVYDVEFADPKATRVLAVTLRADMPSPFAPRSDEAAVKKAEPAKAPGQPAAPEFHIDLEGISRRIVALPAPPGNLSGLSAGKDMVLYATLPTIGLSGPVSTERPAIHVFEMKERKDHVLISGAERYALSYDGKKLLYAEAKTGAEEGGAGSAALVYGIIDTAPPAAPHKVGDGRLDLSSMSFELDPRAEWKQMFTEAWRQERDYFFEAAMNGVDWEKQREKYAVLLPYVADRYDLTFVIGEMIGELCNSHTYVGGGDYPDLHPVKSGLLGVDFDLDAASGRYRFRKIYSGNNWDEGLRSPLTEPGLGVREGDYLLAVNGRALRTPQDPYELLVNIGGQDMTLTVNSRPDESGARSVVVKPIASELSLRQLDWIEANRHKVDRATGGKVGYVYLADMEGVGLNQFVEQFFPQIRKEGLIIDIRYNGGGFVDQLIFERLRRVLAGMDSARNWKSGTIPDIVFHGPMASIANAYTASDGDFFSYFFKRYKLGPLIGERTWGGVRGIRGEIPLVDGGYITRPEFSLYNLDSQWVIENHGVDPDIVVDNRPELVVKGEDPQLERAIEEVMKAIKENPRTLPPRPPELPAYPPVKKK
jgi:tricorn protease